MIQLYDKLPFEYGEGGGMVLCDTGKYCKAWDAQQLFNVEMAKVQFLQEYIPEAKRSPWNNYKFPQELSSGMICFNGVNFCVAKDAQQLLNRLFSENEFWRSHIPDIGCAHDTWNDPVRC